MDDTLEVNLPTYQMEPDPPRFPLRRLVRYLLLIVMAALVFIYRVELAHQARALFNRFDKAMPPPREYEKAPPVARVRVAPPAVIPPPLPVQPTPQIRDEPEEIVVAPPERRPAPAALQPGDIVEPSRARPLRPVAIDKWFSGDDYPAQALRERAEGTVKLRLFVTPGGRARACRILKSSGHRSLDTSTCRMLLTRARFRPELDDDGKAVDAEWDHSFGWKISR